jgi:hypothetical protein
LPNVRKFTFADVRVVSLGVGAGARNVVMLGDHADLGRGRPAKQKKGGQTQGREKLKGTRTRAVRHTPLQKALLAHSEQSAVKRLITASEGKLREEGQRLNTRHTLHAASRQRSFA